MKETVIPIVIGPSDTIPKNLEKKLKKVKIRRIGTVSTAKIKYIYIYIYIN